MLTYERNGKTYQLDEENIPDKSTEYLLQYGFAQSLQDSIAGLAKAVREEYLAKDKESGTTTPANEIELAVDMAIEAQLNKRTDAIKAGTVGVRVGVTRDPFAAMCNRVALDMLRNALKAANTKLPKEKEKVAELVATLIDRNREKVETEAKRRMAEAASVEIDLQGIL